ncbi:MAG: biotin--[Clostridia bacterium]|nr:biotin--[acetyl-CoA-carboxylase] ligase [Clostridia bacterium]
VGRYDRKFFSPSDSGVYFSLAINPKIEIALTTNITVLMAVAVAQAIEEFSKKRCDIKWVNDLLVNSKKVCGILTEGSINLETMSMNFVIVGVGINLYSPTDGFDKTIKNIAGGIFDKKDSIDKNEFVAKIIKNFYNYLPNLNSPALFDEYQKRLAFIGQKVDVLKNSQKIFEGIVLGVDESFKLIVKNLADGQIVKLDSGEISTRQNK